MIRFLQSENVETSFIYKREKKTLNFIMLDHDCGRFSFKPKKIKLKFQTVTKLMLILRFLNLF